MVSLHDALFIVVLTALSVVVNGQTQVTASPQSGQSVSHSDSSVLLQPSWSDPTDIFAADNNFAEAGSVSSSDITRRLLATNFGFNVADAVEIVGVSVSLLRSRRGGEGGRDFSIELVVGGAAEPASDICTVEDCQTGAHLWGDGFRLDTFGGPTYLWGLDTLTPDVIASEGFGVSIRGTRLNVGGGTPDLRVDHVLIDVYYLTAVQVEERDNEGGGNGGAIAAGILIPLLIIGCIVGGIFGFIWVKRNRPDLIEKAKHISLPAPRARSGQSSVPLDEEKGSSTPYEQQSTSSIQVQPSHNSSTQYTESGTDSPMPTRAALPDVATYQDSPNTSGPNILFGVPLQHAKKEGKVPIVISQCIAILEQKGLKEEGLLRLSGSNNDVMNLKKEYDRGKRPDLDSVKDLHNIGGVMKLYLRELPQRILMMTQGIKDASELSDSNEIANIMKEELKHIPEVNFLTLKMLFEFLNKIAANAEDNRMPADNLAIVFQPTLHIPRSVLITLITHCTTIF